MSNPRYLVTGGAGFVGSHTVRHLLLTTDAHLVLPLTCRHRGRWDRISKQIEDIPDATDRITVMMHDLRSPFSESQVRFMGRIDAMVNIASESHVDRSISDPVPFVEDNVSIILNTLELARQIKPRKFLQISTDEVYGPALHDVRHEEWSPIIPSNPYSASKAAQEAIAISYWRTYGVPVILTNTMNIIGEMQDPEKFIPKVIRSLARQEPVTVHVDTDGTPGSRFYLHARNQADALKFILETQEPRMYPFADRPQRFNVVGDTEASNLDIVRLIGAIMDVNTGPLTRLEQFHSSRPGHDLRYALDGQKLASYGWKAPVPFLESFERTVKWTLEHPEWL